ncbi:hypothetical protein QCE48_15665 [Caballeronia sp. LZ024]|nr:MULTISPECIES: hypothetical protein [unclassified Caballeronia]MDR5752224.1 hypothetical protein [Caballeronia sp. LZ024]MDR5841741.1 hypothetical protein [Caballeronia sp. LZ031]
MKSVDYWHLDVEQDNAWRTLLGKRDGVDAVGCPSVKPFKLKRRLYRDSKFSIVVHDQSGNRRNNGRERARGPDA